MTIEEQIRDSLQKMAAEVGPAPTVLATVVAVDQDAQTIDLQDDDGTLINGVRLRPVIDGNTSTYFLPENDTWCLAVRIENEANEWMALAFGEIEKWKIVAGDSSFTMTPSGFVFKKANDTLWDGMKLFFEALEVIVVLQGTNPDRVKLAQAKAKIKSILNGT